jgi:uncharacterized protein YxeA
MLIILIIIIGLTVWFYDFLQDGFMDFFHQDGSSKEEDSSSSSRWGMAAVAGLGIGALLMLATR